MCPYCLYVLICVHIHDLKCVPYMFAYMCLLDRLLLCVFVRERKLPPQLVRLWGPAGRQRQELQRDARLRQRGPLRVGLHLEQLAQERLLRLELRHGGVVLRAQRSRRGGVLLRRLGRAGVVLRGERRHRVAPLLQRCTARRRVRADEYTWQSASPFASGTGSRKKSAPSTASSI